MSYPVTVYTRPHGRARTRDTHRISTAAEAFFREHSIKISMEELPGGQYCIWADYGKLEKDGTPTEHIYVVPVGEDLRSAFDEVATEVEVLTRPAPEPEVEEPE